VKRETQNWLWGVVVVRGVAAPVHKSETPFSISAMISREGEMFYLLAPLCQNLITPSIHLFFAGNYFQVLLGIILCHY